MDMRLIFDGIDLFLKRKGYGAQPVLSVLIKLSALSNDRSFLSSNPVLEAQAKGLRENTLSPRQIEDRSLLSRIVDWLEGPLVV